MSYTFVYFRTNQIINCFRAKSNERFDTDGMAKEFLSCFSNHVLSVSQPLLFQVPEQKNLMLLKIKSIEGTIPKLLLFDMKYEMCCFLYI